MSSPRRGPDISAAQVAGSALAAVSAAVVASVLGVGGTVTGAALGSVVASIGGAVYSHSFRRAGSKLVETKVMTVVTSRHSAGGEGPGPSDVPIIQDPPDETSGETSGAASAQGLAHPSGDAAGGPADETAVTGDPVTASPLPPPGERVPRWLSWKAAVALAVVAFLLAIAAIQVVELVIGRPISGGSGGTTISHLVNPKRTTHKTPKPTPKPSPSAPVVTSTPSPTGSPTVSPTSTPTSTPTTTASPTTTPSGTPTG
jgi:hypothetical protein